jgi:hypothetical protein
LAVAVVAVVVVVDAVLAEVAVGGAWVVTVSLAKATKVCFAKETVSL